MASFKFLSSDPLLKLFKENPEAIQYMPNMPYPSFHFQSNDPEFVDEINESNGATRSYNSFKITTDNMAQIEQVVNYNSFAYYDFVLNESEPKLFSIYQTTLEDDSVFSGNPTREIFLEPNLQFETFKNPEAISIDPSLSTGATAEYKGIFPTFVNFNFPAAVGSENFLLDTLQDQQMYFGLIEFLHNTTPTSVLYELSTGATSYDTYDVAYLPINVPDQFSDSKVTHVGDYNTTYYNEIFHFLERAMLNHKLATLKDSASSLTYKDLINGDPTAINQIVCYRIDKYPKGSSTVMQTFYVPAIDGYRNFIDTQVIFGKTYTYEVSAIMAVYGFDYTYQASFTNPFQPSVAMVEITSEIKTLRLIRIPILRREVAISAFAPTRPDISFLNRSNEQKTMRFYFEPNKHETREEFIIIEEEDKDNQVSAILDVYGKMIFKMSEQTLDYEIFKLDYKPNSYEEFKDNLHTTVPNTTPASSESFEMRLSPNRKYYFMFRSRNEFGLASNPSAVYEVELIQDSDETRVAVKTVDFITDASQSTRTFGRFMKIYPSFDQVSINNYPPFAQLAQDPFELNNKKFYVGDSESPIWGRKFKIRVRSRNTGKVVDLNVNFILNKVESEENLT